MSIRNKETFLSFVTAELIESYAPHFQDLCVVFPTRRAGVFFREMLAKQKRKTFWVPHIFSIQDFVRKHSGFQFPELIPLVHKLYKVHLELMKAKDPSWSESFEKFYTWGALLIKDFDEIDKNLVNTQQLFQNVLELKEIDAFFSLSEEEKSHLNLFWESLRGPHMDEPTEIQERFLQIWNTLYEIYSAFRERLIADNLAYDGLAYRTLHDKIVQADWVPPYHKIVFIGFNSLSTSEMYFIEKLLRDEHARVYWDVDESYFSDMGVRGAKRLPLGRKPSKFIQTYVKRWKEFDVRLIKHDMLAEDKHIHLTAVPSQAGQSLYIAQQFQTLNIEPEDYSRYAIVLADEQLLFPVLYALPPNLPAVNITMGFPLRHTHVYHLFLSIAKLLRSLVIENNSCQMNYAQVIEVLQNSFVRTANPTLVQRIQDEIMEHNILLLSPEYLSANFELPPLLEHLFHPPIHSNQIISYYEGLFHFIMEDAQERKAYPEAEYTFRLFVFFNQLRDILVEEGENFDLKSFGQLFKEVMKFTSIPFEGEPLRGLQLMGFLETRVLDFEKVFILAANEGTLPKGNRDNSFIPYNLRRAFGLPTYEELDNIYAYHFFRLIQRAKEVHLVYNSLIKDYSGAGEMSRFLYQIQYFLEPYEHIYLHRHSLSMDASYYPRKEITVPQHEAIQEKLSRKYVSGSNSKSYLSASAMNTYLACPLKFYFKYIAEIAEPDHVEEIIENSTFGKILHQTLELFYAPYLKNNTWVEEDAYSQSKVKLQNCLKKAFDIHQLSWDEQLKGKNFIMKDAIFLLCEKVIEQDKKQVPFKIPFLEDEGFFFSHIQVDDKSIKLNGMLDRVDYFPDKNLYQIVDYKTGRMKEKIDVSIPKCFEDDTYKEVFQGYLYSYLFRQKVKEGELQVGFYQLRNMVKGMKKLKEGMSIESADLEEFEQYLTALIHRIFTEDFVQTQDEDKCRYCAYRYICQRN